jgi:prevent-host-death family protein
MVNLAIMAFLAKIAIVKRVAATEAKNRLGAVLDDAQREPVVIQRQERDVAVVLSMAEFERMRSGNVRAFLELRNEVAAEAKRNGLTEKKLKALLGDEG